MSGAVESSISIKPLYPRSSDSAAIRLTIHTNNTTLVGINTLRVGITIFIVCCSTSFLEAATIVSNLSETPGTGMRAGTLSGNDRQASTGFTTGSNASGYSLESVTFNISDITGSPSNFVLAIYSDSSGDPGTSSEVLSGTTPSSTGEHTFTASSFNLSANTTYHVVMTATGSPDNNFFRWGQNASNSETSSDGWTIADDGLTSSNGGTSWSGNDGISGLFSIQATAVPEPQAYAAVVSACLIALAVNRRKRNASSANATA